MIGEVGLVVLAAFSAVTTAGTAPQATTHSPNLLLALSQRSDCAWESTAGVPVSLSIENAGENDDRLVGASSPIAWRIGIESTRFVGGRPQTKHLSGGLEVPAGEQITLEAGDTHLTLFGLRTDLVQGETFPVTLHFDRAGELTVVARVRRKVDAAGTLPLPPVSVGDLTVARVSAPPAAKMEH